MILPQIPNIDRTREYTQEFKGYNHNLRIAENEFYDEFNVSADNYPVLSTRKKRNRISEGFNGKLCGAVGRGEDLYYVIYEDGEAKLYKRDKDGESTSLNVELDGDNSPRKMIFFGAYLLIYPDGVYCNTADNFESGDIASVSSNFNFDIYLEYNATSLDNVWWNSVSGVQRITESELKLRNENYPAGTYDIGEIDGSEHCYFVNMFIAQVNDEGKLKSIGYWVKHSAVGDGKGYGINEVLSYLERFRLKVEISAFKLQKNKIYIDFSQLGAIFPDGTYCKGWYENGEKVKFVKNDETNVVYIQAAMPYSSVSFVDGTCYTYEKRLNLAVGTEGGKREFEYDSSKPVVQAFSPYKFCPTVYDYMTECQNRLWKCKCGENEAGKFVNEIQFTALGTFDDWSSQDAVAASGGAISVGTPGEFTGAAVINQNPVFFKEDYIHKVYVSGSGAHQITTLECQGLQESSSKSLALVNGYIFYKTRNDVVLFDGTNVTSISSALGDMKYENAVAGVSGNKYVMYCEDAEGDGHIFTYDTKTGIWHKETAPDHIIDMTVCDGKLYMISDNAIDVHDDESGDESVPFMFETGDIGFSTPDKKYISRIDLRVSLEFGARMRFWMQYDSDGNWIESGTLHGMDMIPKPISLPILPRRCDHFRIKVTGTGKFNLYAMTKILEQGE